MSASTMFNTDFLETHEYLRKNSGKKIAQINEYEIGLRYLFNLSFIFSNISSSKYFLHYTFYHTHTITRKIKIKSDFFIDLTRLYFVIYLNKILAKHNCV
jgi:hypothetical protein